MKSRFLFITVLLLSALPVFAQSGWQPQHKELVGPLYFLSSPLLEGREAGQRGSMIAAEYIASRMMEIGITPAGDDGGWFQDFYVEEKELPVRNVLGIIRGLDTTKYVVLGAHHDHLGIRRDSIFAGADDNASGVSGLLALAKRWNDLDAPPPCNLLFATGDAEEKDMEGSNYFVRTFGSEILLYMNFDMISRSDPKDTLCNILEIGILKGRTDYRELAERNNVLADTNFVLDFWETEGKGGSDYIGFAKMGIPVMAFFAGLNGEYHSPADTRDKIDWEKMIRVLTLANRCLEEFICGQF